MLEPTLVKNLPTHPYLLRVSPQILLLLSPLYGAVDVDLVGLVPVAADLDPEIKVEVGEPRELLAEEDVAVGDEELGAHRLHGDVLEVLQGVGELDSGHGLNVGLLKHFHEK